MPPLKFVIPVPPFRDDPRIACKDEDPETFYPPTYRESSVTPARRVCQACPLEYTCAAWAIKVGEAHGVWGGTTPDERRAVRRVTRR